MSTFVGTVGIPPGISCAESSSCLVESARDREAEQKPAGSGKEGKVVGEGDRTERRVRKDPIPTAVIP